MRKLARYENSSLDTYEGEKEMIDILKDGVKTGFKRNVVIIGGVGTGKTHIAYSIVKSLSKPLNDRYYASSIATLTTIKDIIDSIKTCWKSSADEYDYQKVENFKKIPLLVIDEVGVQYGSESERIELFEIFNARYNDMLPTIAISNCDKKQMMTILGQRICDRLFGDADVFELKTESRRKATR